MYDWLWRLDDRLTSRSATFSPWLLAVAVIITAAFLSETWVLSSADASWGATMLVGLVWCLELVATFWSIASSELTPASLVSSSLPELSWSIDSDTFSLLSASLCCLTAICYFLNSLCSYSADKFLSTPAMYRHRPVLCAIKSWLSSSIIVISNAFKCAMSNTLKKLAWWMYALSGFGFQFWF